MQCERAQEFFSDYLERTLDRPMTVALEAHLAGCSGCREEIEALQATVYALDTAPQVAPPPDGMWQVHARLANLRAAEHEARRRRAPGLLEWLRGLSPMSAAMGAGLATLVIGGTFVASRLPSVTGLNLVPWPTPAATPVLHPADPAATPGLDISYGAVTGDGTQVKLTVTPASALPDARVSATVSSTNRAYTISGPSNPQRPLVGLLTLPVGTPSEVLHVTVASQLTGRQWSYVVLVPLTRQGETRVTQSFFDQPVSEALRRVGPSLSAPVVVDADPAATVSLSVSDAPPQGALQALADQLHATLHRDGASYHLTPSP